MKYAWVALIAGVALVSASAVNMWNILVLELGFVIASGGLTALFLNAKRLEALKEEGNYDNAEESMGKEAA